MNSLLNLFNALVTWNSNFEDNPEGGDSPSYGDDEIRLLKSAIRERFEKEHTMDLTTGTVGSDGWHKAGSTKMYYQAAAPTTRPDGTTALTADDNGRRWVRSTDKREYVYVHPDWIVVTLLSGSDNTFSGDNTFNGENTFTGDTYFDGTIYDKNGLEVNAVQYETKQVSDTSTGWTQAEAVTDVDVIGFSFTPTAVLNASVHVWDTDSMEGNGYGSTASSYWPACNLGSEDGDEPYVRITGVTPGTNKVTVRVYHLNNIAGNIYYRITVTAVRS